MTDASVALQIDKNHNDKHRRRNVAQRPPRSDDSTISVRTSALCLSAEALLENSRTPCNTSNFVGEVLRSPLAPVK